MTETLKITTPTDREAVLTRVFDAPAALVFDALTNPELIRQWSVPPGWSLVVCDVDLRVDGKWRFVSTKPDGRTVGQYGVYREIVPGERLVQTELWEDWDAGETLVTTVLSEQRGQTTFTSTIRFPSQEVRDTVLKHGLTSGAAGLYDRLAELLMSALRAY
ncbi:MAG: SRPBCC family protein [Vicinamibacterales bacterium]